VIRLLVFALFLTVVACETKPKVAPTPIEFKNSFYSLKQSGVFEYRCEIRAKTLADLTDSEIDYLFKNQFRREASLQEKGMLRNLHWNLLNSNEKQEAVPNIRIRDFPTTESANIAERLTQFLNLINKVLTLTYLENFADRPDLKNVTINDKFFQVVSNLEEVVAEVEFNQKKYRIFYGEKAGVIEVTLQPLGSMKIPSMIRLAVPKTTKQETPATIDLFFDLFDGLPRLTHFTATAHQLENIPLRFAAENCDFTK
jgi:hypothetical protein